MKTISVLILFSLCISTILSSDNEENLEKLIIEIGLKCGMAIFDISTTTDINGNVVYTAKGSAPAERGTSGFEKAIETTKQFEKIRVIETRMGVDSGEIEYTFQLIPNKKVVSSLPSTQIATTRELRSAELTDSFKTVHVLLKEKIKSLEGGVKFSNNALEIHPPNGRFYSLLYEVIASDRATIEGSAKWKDGDANVMFGIICCAKADDEFYVLMVTGRQEFLLQRYAKEKWFDLTGFMTLPKNTRIQKNVSYRVKIVVDGQYVSAFLNDILLVNIFEASDHKGKVGIFAQGGKIGESIVAFHSFHAKNN